MKNIPILQRHDNDNIDRWLSSNGWNYVGIVLYNNKEFGKLKNYTKDQAITAMLERSNIDFDHYGNLTREQHIQTLISEFEADKRITCQLCGSCGFDECCKSTKCQCKYFETYQYGRPSQQTNTQRLLRIWTLMIEIWRNTWN